MGRLFIDVADDGLLTVSVQVAESEGPRRVAGPARMVWPMGPVELDDLRWYLEEYLRAPFGVYEERGPRIAARLPEWGERMFRAVFPEGPARKAYGMVRARGPVGLVVRSGAARWLAMPWELMACPGERRPLALDGATFSRSLMAGPPQPPLAVRGAGAAMRVLLVISRPNGVRDIRYRMIARPLMEALESAGENVELVVLRPPTLEGLATTLREASRVGEPFRMVRFDGHGMFGEVWEDGVCSTQGMLFFEGTEGGPDLVPTARVAQVLAGAEVPVVVLNACQSGAVGTELEAAVAARLVREGTASVVALAYSAFATAAAEFMSAFYRELCTGVRISEAVMAGRVRLAEHDRRPSPKGPVPLADWFVPVLYQRGDVFFPDLTATPGGLPASPSL